MKLKNLFVSLILVISAALSLVACQNTNVSDGTQSWFSNASLEQYGLLNLPKPDAKNFSLTQPEGNYLLYLTANNISLDRFEQYVLNIVNFFNTNIPNTFGYKDGASSEAPKKTYTCNRVKKSNIIYSYNTAGNSQNVYEFFYTPAPLSADVQFVQNEGSSKPIKVKLWDGEKTFHLMLKYYSTASNGFEAESMVLYLDQPNQNEIRYYTIFDGSIVE